MIDTKTAFLRLYHHKLDSLSLNDRKYYTKLWLLAFVDLYLVDVIF